MNTPLEQLLTESKRLRDAATPGPWINLNSDRFAYLYTEIQSIIADGKAFVLFKNSRCHDDTRFIAHARNTAEAKDEIIRGLMTALQKGHCIEAARVHEIWEINRLALDRANELAEKAMKD